MRSRARARASRCSTSTSSTRSTAAAIAAEVDGARVLALHADVTRQDSVRAALARPKPNSARSTCW
jgi:hypothetical protein